MKYLCAGCERLVAPASFAVEAGVLVLRCERCGDETRAGPAAPAGAPPPSAPPLAAEPPRPERASAAAPQPSAAEPRGAAPRQPPPPQEAALPAAHAPRTEPGAPSAARGEGPRGQGEPAAQAPRAALRVVSLHSTDESVRQAAQLARAEDPFATPEGHCPKCLAPRPGDALICTRCGLVYANFRPEEHRPSAPLGEAWVALLQHWDDEARHDRFVQLALARGELAGAGRLYRLRLAQAPADPFAQRGRDEVLGLASASTTAALSRERSAAASPRQRTRAALLGGLLLLALLTSLLLVVRSCG